MDKKGVVAALEEIGMLLELTDDNPFKSRSYVNVARELEQCEEDIDTLVREKRLREIKGVGEAIEKKIEELVSTGRLRYLEDLRARFPGSLLELFRIPSLGAKRIKMLFEELHIQSLEELETACKEDKLSAIKGFGPRMQEKILEGIAFARRHTGLFLFDVAEAEAVLLKEHLAADPSIARIEIAGSIRRFKEIIRDIDILASSRKPADLMNRFTAAANVVSVTARGDTKSSVVLRSGITADLRVVSETQFPYALHYFTGSKEHNVAVRQRARAKGLKLNEYGLFRDEKNIRCRTEAEIYARLDLPYIPPELREDMGELDVPRLPNLVEMKQIKGMFHCHTSYSDGTSTIEQMAEACRQRGYSYLTITDHSQSAAYAGGMNVAAVERQHREIDEVNKRMKGFCVLKGIESDIKTNGDLDYDDRLLAKFELVIGSIHSKLAMTEAEATARTIRAIENPYLTILGHPTGRLLLSRQGYSLDMDKVIDACAANGVAIEINANCRRLDLDWRHVKRAKEKGVKLCTGPDAHSVQELDNMRYGVGVARKGWLEPDDLLNCMTAEEFLTWRKAK